MDGDAAQLFTNRLSAASREELLEHVLLQRDLIQRLHARVLDLEECLESQDRSEHELASSSWLQPTQSPRRDQEPPETLCDVPRNPLPTHVSDHQATPSRAANRLEEINTVLAAHTAGRPRLPANMVRQLLLIREDLKSQCTSPQAVGRTPLDQRRPPSRLVNPRWVQKGMPTPVEATPRVPHNGFRMAEQYYADEAAPPFLAQRLVSAWDSASSPQ